MVERQPTLLLSLHDFAVNTRYEAAEGGRKSENFPSTDREVPSSSKSDRISAADSSGKGEATAPYFDLFLKDVANGISLLHFASNLSTSSPPNPGGH